MHRLVFLYLVFLLLGAIALGALGLLPAAPLDIAAPPSCWRPLPGGPGPARAAPVGAPVPGAHADHGRDPDADRAPSRPPGALAACSCPGVSREPSRSPPSSSSRRGSSTSSTPPPSASTRLACFPGVFDVVGRQRGAASAGGPRGPPRRPQGRAPAASRPLPRGLRAFATGFSLLQGLPPARGRGGVGYVLVQTGVLFFRRS